MSSNRYYAVTNFQYHLKQTQGIQGGKMRVVPIRKVSLKRKGKSLIGKPRYSSLLTGHMAVLVGIEEKRKHVGSLLSTRMSCYLAEAQKTKKSI